MEYNEAEYIGLLWGSGEGMDNWFYLMLFLLDFIMFNGIIM